MYTIDRDIVCLGMNELLRHALVLSDPLPDPSPPFLSCVCLSSSVDSVSVSLFPGLFSCSHYIMCSIPSSFLSSISGGIPGRGGRRWRSTYRGGSDTRQTCLSVGPSVGPSVRPSVAAVKCRGTKDAGMERRWR